MLSINKILCISLIFILFNTLIFPQTKSDLLVLTYNEINSLYEMNIYKPDGTHLLNKSFSDSNIIYTASGDFDGDALEEFLIVSKLFNDYKFTLYKFNNNNWELTLTDSISHIKPSVTKIKGISSGDIDGDGIDDLIMVIENPIFNNRFNTVSILKSDGSSFNDYYEFELWDYSFAGVSAGDYNGDGRDEISVYRVEGGYNITKYNWLLIISVTEYSHELLDNSVFLNDNFSNICSGDYDGDGIDEITLVSDNSQSGKNVLILTIPLNQNLTVYQRILISENPILGLFTSDLNSDYLDDLIFINTNSLNVNKAQLYLSNMGYLNEFLEFQITDNKVISAVAINFRTLYPHTYLTSQDISFILSKGNERGASNYIQFHIVNAVNNFIYNNVSSVFKLIDDQIKFNDYDRSAFSTALKKIGLGYQLRRDQILNIEEAKNAFIYIAEYATSQLDYISKHPEKFNFTSGILASQTLYDAMILNDLAWAYDLLFNEFTPEERRQLRTKLFIPLIEWQIRYCSGRGNHEDWHNLAIGEVGFAINWKRYIAIALKGSDISNNEEGFFLMPKGFWQGLAEQLSNPIENENIIPPDIGYWGNGTNPAFGSYHSDFTDDEGSVFYTHFSLLGMVRLAKIAQTNNYYINFFDYPKGVGAIDRIATNLAKLVYPDLTDYPDINNEILDESPAQTFEILESVLYADPPKPSPYTKLLKTFQGSYNGTVVDIDEDLYFFKGFGLEEYSYYTDSFLFDKGGWGLIRSKNLITDPNKLYLLFDFGPYGCNNHGHADRLNLILYRNKYGELLKDKAKIRNTSSGFFGYSSHIQARWVESTLSHNTILINGQRQADPDYQVFKPSVKDNLYGLTSHSEHLFANRISVNLQQSLNNDTLQFVSAKVPFSAAYGENFEVERMVSLLGNKFVVDEINVERRNVAPIEFIDLIYNGPTLDLITNPRSVESFSLTDNQVNQSYQYFYDVNRSREIENEFWNATWLIGQDSILKIFGFSFDKQALFSAKAPADLSFDGIQENVNLADKKSSLIIRNYSYLAGVSEFINVLDPTQNILDIEYDSEKESLEIFDKSNNQFTYQIKYGPSKRSAETPGEITGYELFQNFPNPFNNSTTIRYSMISSSNVVFKLYNGLGELVMELSQGWRTPGKYNINIDMKNLASGIYLYYIDAADFKQAKKMILLK